MTSKANESLSVLRYWRDLELFNIPAAPSVREATDQTKISTLRPGSALPWQNPDFAPAEDHGYVHVCYLGVADIEDLSGLLLEAVLPAEGLSERERQRATGTGWLAAFVVDERGSANPDSYMAASFVHGVKALRETGALANINSRLTRAREEFAQRCHRLAAPTREGAEAAAIGTCRSASLTWRELEAETQLVRQLLGPAADAAALDWRVVVRSSRVKRRYLSDSLQAASDFLNSFYLDDLDRLIAQASAERPFGTALEAYLGQALPEEKRTDILVRHDVMAGLVTAARLPCSRWPASYQHPLMLAQQAAVAHVLDTLGSADGILGVNGPPGTGKTTLLCDVVANIVTQRARRLAALERPVALFDEKITVAGKSFFPVTSRVMAGTSIVVASTNNNAVKNITQELPSRKKVAGEYGPVTYFAEVMDQIFKLQKVMDEREQPLAGWGVIAAALGNVGNRRSFAQGFFRDEYVPREESLERTDDEAMSRASSSDQALDANAQLPSMKQLLEAASDDYQRYQQEWQSAKQRFLELTAEFEQRREVLVRAEAAALRLDASQARWTALEADIQTTAAAIADGTPRLARQRETQTDQRALVEANQALLMQCQAALAPSLWDRLLALFGRSTARMKRLQQACEVPARELAEASQVLATLAKQTAQLKAELERLQERAQSLSAQQALLVREIDAQRQVLLTAHTLGARHFPNQALWSLSAADRHRASVAVYAELDALRARLFLQGVELHRLTLLANAGKFIANLRAVSAMLTGASRSKLPVEQRPLLWDAFFFVVPVVSTTLASFDRLFLGMEQDSLGWLLLDEAGQATPQSAAGAIWRSRRAVIVGDPLQIEPVFTVPLGLAEDLRRRHGVASAWSPSAESVQTLADRITPFGSWVNASEAGAGAEQERLWTGIPLRTHRRCDDPMFSVANRIAYAGQMVQGRVDHEGQATPIALACPLGDSAWIDVRSNRVQHPVSEDELDQLRECLMHLRSHPARVLARSPDQADEPAKVFVISPFRKIARACAALVRKERFQGVECGTVHTFQGKEADIVFLILGSAPGVEGAGARAWAAGKPNLLNVAITRAKCRLYVVGDVTQWGGLDYFRPLREALRVIDSPAMTPPGARPTDAALPRSH